MKKLYTLLLCSIGLGTTINNCHAQLLINADAVVASSTDFLQASALVDANTSNYAYLSAALGVLSTSSITVSFPQSGHAGDIVSFSIQGTGGLLSTSLLNNTTIRLYDDNNVNVANASGSTLLTLDLGLSGPNVYTLKYVTDPTASYTIKKATLEFNNVLSVQVLNEIRVYNAFIQTPCTAVFATSVNSAVSTGLLGFISNSTNAVNGNSSSFATIGAGVLGSAYIDLAFAVKGTAGEFVGFTISQSATLLSLSLLQNVSIDVYNSSGTIVSTKNNFALTDLKLLTGSTDKYIIGYTTAAGAYDIARLRITLGGINVLTSLNVFNAMHFKMTPATVSITSSGTSFCDGASVTLTANTTSSPSTIVWSNGSTANPITVSNTNTLSFTATDAEGCISTSLPITLTKLPIPTVSITNGATASFCNGSNVTLTAVPSAGASILWSTGATTNAISVSSPGTYTVNAIGTNLCQSLQSNVVVTQLALPTVSITNGPAASFCSNKNVVLTAVPSAGATILWSNGATTNTIMVNAAGTYTVTATGTNLCNSDVASVNVTSLTIPTVSVTNGPSASFCSNKNIVLTAVPSAGATVLWSNGATTNDITVNAAGTYTVTATGTNLCNSDIASVTVTSLTIPTVSVTNGPAATFCSNKNVVLTAVPSAGATVLWSNGATTNDITVNAAGTYTVTATDANLCSSADANVIVSSLTAPTISITATGPTDICAKDNVTLSATPSAGSSVIWSNGASTNDITVNMAGDFSATATASNGCTNISTIITVTLKSSPSVTGSAEAITCNGLNNGSITLIPVSLSASYQYSWSNGATASSINQLTPGNYTVTITDNTTLCTTDLAYVISQPQSLSLVGITTKESCSGNDATISFEVSGGTLPYSYNSSLVKNDRVIGLTAGTYTFTITDKNMCQLTQSYTIEKVNCSTALNIHNVVTPNNDGLNDVMVIEGIENFPHCSLEIFDKWGDVVYNKDDYDNSWNGRNKNDSGPLPAGTYYYLLKLNTNDVPNGKSDYTGFVMIQ